VPRLGPILVVRPFRVVHGAKAPHYSTQKTPVHAQRRGSLTNP